MISNVYAHEILNANENWIVKSENNVYVSTSNVNVMPSTCTSINDMLSSLYKKRIIENSGESLQMARQKSLNKIKDELVRRLIFVEYIFPIGKEIPRWRSEICWR